MSNKRTINIKPAFCERRVRHDCKSDITIHDRYKDGRKQQQKVVLNDMSPSMLGHLARTCMDALNQLERDIQAEIKSVRER